MVMLMADSRWLTASSGGAGLSIGIALAKCKSREHHDSLARQHQHPLPQALVVTDHAIERRQHSRSAVLALQHVRAGARDGADVLLEPAPRDPQHDNREAVRQDAGGAVAPRHLKQGGPERR